MLCLNSLYYLFVSKKGLEDLCAGFVASRSHITEGVEGSSLVLAYLFISKE